MQVIGEVGRVADDVVDSWCLAASRAAAARGVVGIVDMERPWSLDAWLRRIAGGNRSLRVVSAVWPERFADVNARRLHTGDDVDGSDGLLTVGPLKVITDGSLNTRTAYCHHPYPSDGGTPEQRGILLVAVDELSQLMTRARRMRVSTAPCTPSAMLRTPLHCRPSDARERTEASSMRNCSTMPTSRDSRNSDSSRVFSLSMRSTIATSPITTGPAGRGVPSRFAPSSMQGQPSTSGRTHPWRRSTRGWRSPQPFTAAGMSVQAGTRSRRSPIAEALGASMPHGRGSIALCDGDAADLVILDRDPFTADPRALRTMPVAATMIAGSWTHRVGL